MGKTGRIRCCSRSNLHFGIPWNGILKLCITSLVAIRWAMFADAIPLFRVENLLDRLLPIEKQNLLSGPSCCGEFTSFLRSNNKEYIHNGVAFPRSPWRCGRQLQCPIARTLHFFQLFFILNHYYKNDLKCSSIFHQASDGTRSNIPANTHIDHLCSLDINTKASRVRLSGIICTIGK